MAARSAVLRAQCFLFGVPQQFLCLVIKQTCPPSAYNVRQVLTFLSQPPFACRHCETEPGKATVLQLAVLNFRSEISGRMMRSVSAYNKNCLRVCKILRIQIP